LLSLTVAAQKPYTVSGGEMIFQSALVEDPNGDAINTNLRFSGYFHFGEYVHFDMGDHIGLFSGIGMRNVGFIIEEEDIKTKFRSYNLGIPIAVKAGSFARNLYVFGGAEYEWMFHFKQKVFDNGDKIKYNKWFSDRTPRFIPSVFAGMQFPAGIQLKFRYYLNNFLNNQYQGSGSYSDYYAKYDKTRVWYISVSYMIKNNKIRESASVPIEVANL
jgi:hypothetical protein